MRLQAIRAGGICHRPFLVWTIDLSQSRENQIRVNSSLTFGAGGR